MDFTYNGSSIPPTNAGSYPVAATIKDPNYTGTTSGTLLIAKAAATITVSDLAQTYTGFPLSARASTNPPGLSIALSYNGSSTAPTNAGSYPMAATIEDPNYTGSTSGTLVIAKAAATITLSNLAQTFTGSPLSVSASTNPPGLTVALSYNGSSTSPTNAGSYPVTASIHDPNYTGSTSGTLVIAKAAATITLSDLAQTYIGSPLSASASTNPPGLTIALSYNGTSTAPTNAGSYPVTATIHDPNYNASTSGTLVISKAAATITLSDFAQTYTSSPLSAGASTNPHGLTVDLTYNGSSTPPTNAGSYPVTATIHNPNYTGSTSGILVISKAAATVTLSNLAQTYTGSPLSASASTNPPGLTIALSYNGSSTAPTNAGSYPISASIQDPNYAGSASATLIIAKALTQVEIMPSLNPVAEQQTLFLSAVVSSTAPGFTGSVSFMDGSHLLGAAKLTGNAASLSLAALEAGSHVITAVFPGNPNFANASSSPLQEMVLNFVVVPTPPSAGRGTSGASQTAAPGGTATYSLAIVPTAGTVFPQPMTLTLEGLPPGAHANIAPLPWTLQPDGSWTFPANTPLPSLTLSVAVPAASASHLPAPPSGRPRSPIFWAVLLLPFAIRRRILANLQSRYLKLLLVVAGAAFALSAISGCGSTSGFFAQPQKTYSLTVTAAAGTLQHATTLTLTVE